MLRVVVILLLVANVAYFAWSQHGLGFMGLQPKSNGQPKSEAQEDAAGQVNADKVTLISQQQLAQAMEQNQEAGQAAEPAPEVAPEPERGQQPKEPPPPPVPVAVQQAKPAICMAVTGLNEEQFQTVRSVLRGLPSAAWSVEEHATPGRWMVFWGSFNDDLEFAAKRSQLVAKGIGFDPVRNAQAGRGFSLGRFSSENAAQQESKRIAQQGINNLRVVKEREDGRTYSVRFQDYENHRTRIQADLRRLLQEKPLRGC